ncbi:HAMP domain-containing protein [Patescibacteria group bacterium]|nr:HAMP domain-containing protein [Patescibacteria group bacterium]MBU1074610.1 HAMP domain-containing protein [Patescibacteria group bacterium]MBU1952399.1 HAMP domain-containing protein [Patescibacteria group bacterium]
MPKFDENSKPFQKQVFRYTAITFIGVLLIINLVVYFTEIATTMSNTKSTLKEIATNVAVNVSNVTHDEIITNDQQDSQEYIEIESYFQNIIAANPIIDDIYTLRTTSDPNVMTFVVAGKETYDANGDNFIDDTEIRPEVGEEYDVTGLDDLKNGLIAPSVDKAITTNKWGQWLSGYAPIVDDKKQTVAILGVDQAASDIADQSQGILYSLLYMDIVLLPLMLMLAYFMARIVSRPFRILAKGMQRISHGELDYRLPIGERGPQAMFVSLFNNMLGMFQNAEKHERKHHDLNE